MPKTLAEIAIDAGLITKAIAVKAGKLSEELGLPLIVVLIRELGIDEVALVGALRRGTRVPLIDPADVQVDPDALRQVARDVCARLRVLPFALTSDGPNKVLKVAMADPTDEAAVAELEQLAHCMIDVSALPLSAIDELVDKGYRQVNTAVVQRPGGSMFVTSRGTLPTGAPDESEVSVTAQVPFPGLPSDADLRLTALIRVLVGKGVISEAELAEALKKP